MTKGSKVEHWLNGEQVLEYELGSKAVLDQVAKTKFKGVADFGTKIRGHILLTYHNDECSFRNIKLRVPKAALLPQAHWDRAWALASHERIAARARRAGFGRVEDVAAGAEGVVQALKGR